MRMLSLRVPLFMSHSAHSSVTHEPASSSVNLPYICQSS